MSKLLDKHGIEIEHGDVFKLFHFIGPRRKRYYMYKMAILCGDKMYASHLNSPNVKPDFALWSVHKPEDTEIVQSKNWEKLE